MTRNILLVPTFLQVWHYSSDCGRSQFANILHGLLEEIGKWPHPPMDQSLENWHPNKVAIEQENQSGNFGFKET